MERKSPAQKFEIRFGHVTGWDRKPFMYLGLF